MNKAMLPVSAMVASYCSGATDCSEKDKNVRDIVIRILNPIGVYCNVDPGKLEEVNYCRKFFLTFQVFICLLIKFVTLNYVNLAV